MFFYGGVSAETESVVEFFLERELAEAMIAEVREDEAATAAVLRIEALELGLFGSHVSDLAAVAPMPADGRAAELPRLSVAEEEAELQRLRETHGLKLARR